MNNRSLLGTADGRQADARLMQDPNTTASPCQDSFHSNDLLTPHYPLLMYKHNALYVHALSKVLP